MLNFLMLFYVLYRNINIAEWLERLAVYTNVATVLSSIPASFDTVESEGWQMKQC
jgi:hypothetical protein